MGSQSAASSFLAYAPARNRQAATRSGHAFAVIDPNNRTNYSPYVQPTTLDGIRCVVVDKKLKATDPNAYRFLLAFAESNELVTENAE